MRNYFFVGRRHPQNKQASKQKPFGSFQNREWALDSHHKSKSSSVCPKFLIVQKEVCAAVSRKFFALRPDGTHSIGGVSCLGPGLLMQRAPDAVGSPREPAAWSTEPLSPGVGVHSRLLPRQDGASSDVKVDVVEGGLQGSPLTCRRVARPLEWREHTQGLVATGELNACFVPSPSSPRECVGKSAKHCKSKKGNFNFQLCWKLWKSGLFSLFSRKGGGWGRTRGDTGVRF